jgi:hypothetical protein
MLACTRDCTQELQGGKTDRLQALVGSTLARIKAATTLLVGFVVTEADEHIPPAAKAQLAAALEVTKVRGLFSGHVLLGMAGRCEKLWGNAGRESGGSLAAVLLGDVRRGVHFLVS